MERESRHSKEEEEELDRKIAQIREKNQKIVERKKEIDAELAIYSDEYQKKSPKPSPISSNKTTKTSKGQWDREWDKGKTPAETWRENVPSMEIRRKPARGGGGGVGLQRGQRGGSKFRTTSSRSGSDNAAPLQVAKGSRLDGRVSVLPAETNTARRGRGRGGARPNYKRRVFTNSNGDVKVNVKLQENQSSQPAQQKNPRKTAKTSPNKGESPKKSSSTLKQRRSTDKYEIRKLLRKLVNKVDQLERRERQKQQSKNSKASKSITPQTTPKTKESSNSVTNSVTSTESSDSKATKHSEADVVSKTIKPSESSKSGADANQNIIKLVEEKVLQIQMS